MQHTTFAACPESQFLHVTHKTLRHAQRVNFYMQHTKPCSMPRFLHALNMFCSGPPYAHDDNPSPTE
jgi:hypothetical protein